MGMFLSLSGVIGKTQKEVISSLSNYAKYVNGGLKPDNSIASNDQNCCILEESAGNTSIFYPYGYMEWDESSAFISKELNTPVFSFHIHDGDFWMYTLYFNGEVVDQFNPIPDYWDEDLSEEEFNSWEGNANVISELIPGINPEGIEKYLVRWNMEAEDVFKAYPEDEFGYEDWQLVDFMKKLGLSYPIDDKGNLTGQAFKLWTTELRLSVVENEEPNLNSITPQPSSKQKSWWKFW